MDYRCDAHLDGGAHCQRQNPSDFSTVRLSQWRVSTLTRRRFAARVDSWKSPRNRHLAGGNPPNDRVPRASSFPRPHVFEPEVRDQVPGDVYEAQVALMEMS